jgi:hypothetical protein
MTDITNVQASQRILAHLHEGRLVQGTWHREQDGRDLACILGAISPHINDTSKCPASVMPKWLAVLTAPMFDGQATDVALAWAGRFGAQMAQWDRLGSAAWDRVRAAFCAACVADARQSADTADASDYAADAYVYAANAADYAASAASAARATDYAASAASCWTRLATALCDLIDAALAAKETT